MRLPALTFFAFHTHTSLEQLSYWHHICVHDAWPHISISKCSFINSHSYYFPGVRCTLCTVHSVQVPDVSGLYNLEGLESRWNFMLSSKVIISLILMQESRRGPPAQLMTSEEDSHPFAADQDGLQPKVNMCASARQSHLTTPLTRHG